MINQEDEIAYLSRPLLTKEQLREKMINKYEVQHFTLCDGWINTWTVDDEPEFFDTYQDAKEALDDFLKEEKKAYKRGEISSMYEADEFQIVEIKA